MAETNIEKMAEDQPASTTTTPKKKSLSDGKRLVNAGTRHGLVALGLFLGFAAADSWYQVTGLGLASALSVITALVAGAWLSSIFHEWGHFAGARVAKSYSPIVPDVRGIFMFGFNHSKNTRNQFISMSLGGSVANWLLVIVVFTLIPMDSLGRGALLAMVFAKAVSVLMFEIPILMKVMNGADSEQAIEEGLNNGSGDRGTVFGYLTGALVWFIAS
jgi:hypothetical protein